MFAQKQISWQNKEIKKATLQANSKRNAFYELSITQDFDSNKFTVQKISGANGVVYDKRNWIQDSYTEALKLFNSKIHDKTKVNRKSPRKYIII